MKKTPSRDSANSKVWFSRGIHDESELYRMDAGQTSIPFRRVINESCGEWRVRLVERQTGLEVTRSIIVNE